MEVRSARCAGVVLACVLKKEFHSRSSSSSVREFVLR
jgi:hypothetical protein